MHRTLLAQLSVFEGGASLRCLSRRLRRGRAGRGAAGDDHGPARRSSSSTPARTRSRGWRCSTPCASSPPRRSSDLDALEARHAAYFLDLRRARGRPGGACGPARVARPARPRARQPADRVRAPAARRTRPRTRCGSRSRSRARCPGMRTRTRCAVGSRRRWRTFDPSSPATRRAAALYWDGQLALAQARFADAEAPLEQALTVAQDLGDAALVAARAGRARPPRRADRLDPPRPAVRGRGRARPRPRRSGAARRRAARARGRV